MLNMNKGKNCDGPLTENSRYKHVIKQHHVQKNMSECHQIAIGFSFVSTGKLLSFFKPNHKG